MVTKFENGVSREIPTCICRLVETAALRLTSMYSLSSGRVLAKRASSASEPEAPAARPARPLSYPLRAISEECIPLDILRPRARSGEGAGGNGGGGNERGGGGNERGGAGPSWSRGARPDQQAITQNKADLEDSAVQSMARES